MTVEGVVRNLEEARGSQTTEEAVKPLVDEQTSLELPFLLLGRRLLWKK